MNIPALQCLGEHPWFIAILTFQILYGVWLAVGLWQLRRMIIAENALWKSLHPDEDEDEYANGG